MLKATNITITKNHKASQKLATLVLAAFFGGCTSMTKSNPWQTMARNDLKAMHDLISKHHPGPFDNQNKEFKDWLTKGYEQAVEKAKKVNKYGGYYATQKFFANGFKDGHLHYFINLKPERIKWPGFTVAKRGDNYIVHSSSDKKGPKKGWKVVSCDGKGPDKLMKSNVFPFNGNEDLAAHWVKYAPQIFLDSDNPFISVPQTCEFETGKGKKEIKLSWRSISAKNMEDKLVKAAFGPRPKQSYSHKGGIVWMTVPTMGPSDNQANELEKMIARLPKARKAKIIVFDVRGNTGGNSEWGTKITRSLYGRDFADPILNKEPEKKSYVEWRISKNNIKHLDDVLPYLKTRFGENSEIYRVFNAVTKGMKKAPSDQLYRQPDLDDDKSEKSRTKKAKNPVKAKVFFLTDGKCASACLDFADNILEMPEVIHVGSPTSADTVYMDVRSEELPSTVARLSFALKVYRNRKRANNEPYIPKHVWDGDMWDTKKLRAWIKALAGLKT